MAKSLKKSIRQKNTKANSIKNLKIPKGQEAKAKELEQQLEDLSGKSEDDLMTQLFAEVEKGKRDDTFTEESLQVFIKNVSPMLNEEQRNRLRALVKQIT